MLPRKNFCKYLNIIRLNFTFLTLPWVVVVHSCIFLRNLWCEGKTEVNINYLESEWRLSEVMWKGIFNETTDLFVALLTILGCFTNIPIYIYIYSHPLAWWLAVPKVSSLQPIFQALQQKTLSIQTCALKSQHQMLFMQIRWTVSGFIQILW